ncbi:MAG: OB-fold domain-containing protein, partial [Hyphomonadaceae bacterium]
MHTVAQAYWEGGQGGQLFIGWCATCAQWRHPSLEFCPACAHEITEARQVCGQARVLAFTINHQQWPDCPPPPYAIAIVGLAEDERVRLTLNIVDGPLDAICIGAPARIVFTHDGDRWIPQGVLVREPATPAPYDAPPKIIARPRRSGEKFEDKAAITGIGASRLGRRLPRSSLALAVDACRAAIEDAGLQRSDIDG